MERANSILNHEKYRKYLARNEKAEAQRLFCRHNMGHFLDVARLAVIVNETEHYGVEKELIYAAALLHDIGRWVQYQEGTPHEKAGLLLAPEILRDCGFDGKEQDNILMAIGEHRNAAVSKERTLAGLLYRADKLSRPCFACEAEKSCDRREEKKNKNLVW